MSTEMETGDPARLQRRLDRERTARHEAEAIAERVTRDLYATVQELNHLNEEFERANLDLQAANQTLKDFVAIAAHDLRGPVSAILGFAGLMAKKWEAFAEDDRREYTEIIERQATYLTRMLDSLLTVSRIEAGALEVHREELEVGAAVRQALEEVGERGVEVEVRCPDGLKVIADPDHVQRILVNYVSNALKYGAPPVTVETRDTGGFVEVAVRDHGEGVPEEFASRLFHKFARAENHVTKKEEGSGLGLSIVQGLAEANEGAAWYEANHPKGSCFAVRLPKKAA